MKLLNTLVSITMIQFGTTYIQATHQTGLRGGGVPEQGVVEYEEIPAAAWEVEDLFYDEE